MDFIISFFRDTLDGPLYVVVVIVNIILFFACIGYLAEKSINNKKEKAKYATVDYNGVLTNIDEQVVKTNGDVFLQDSNVNDNINSQVVNSSDSVNHVEEVAPIVTQPVSVNMSTPTTVNSVVTTNDSPVLDVVIPVISQDNNKKN